MKREKRWLINILYLVIGTILIGLSVAGKVDAFWNGMGSALIVVGIINLIRQYRLNKNEDYRERVELEINDERNRFLRNKAWAWAGYLFLLIAAVASILFRIFQQNLLSMAAAGSVCLVLVLFWISYTILKKKY